MQVIKKTAVLLADLTGVTTQSAVVTTANGNNEELNMNMTEYEHTCAHTRYTYF